MAQPTKNLLCLLFLWKDNIPQLPTNRWFCQNCWWMIDRVRKLKLFCILANLPWWPFSTKICSGQFPPSSPLDIIQANHSPLPSKINFDITRKRRCHFNLIQTKCCQVQNCNLCPLLLSGSETCQEQSCLRVLLEMDSLFSQSSIWQLFLLFLLTDQNNKLQPSD